MLRDCVRDENLAGCGARAAAARAAPPRAPPGRAVVSATDHRANLPTHPRAARSACQPPRGSARRAAQRAERRGARRDPRAPAGAGADAAGRARRLVLEGPLFGQFFEKVEVTNFEVASDAFATFKDLLTRHKALVARYLAACYDQARARLRGGRAGPAPRACCALQTCAHGAPCHDAHGRPGCSSKSLRLDESVDCPSR